MSVKLNGPNYLLCASKRKTRASPHLEELKGFEEWQQNGCTIMTWLWKGMEQILMFCF